MDVHVHLPHRPAGPEILFLPRTMLKIGLLLSQIKTVININCEDDVCCGRKYICFL